jgi:hypothetical protein
MAWVLLKIYYMTPGICDQELSTAFSGEKPALVQSSASRSTAITMPRRSGEVLANVLLFLSFQTHHVVNRTAESNVCRASL